MDRLGKHGKAESGPIQAHFGPEDRKQKVIQGLRMMTTEARESKLIAKRSKALGSVQDAVGQFPVKVDYLSVEGHKKQRTPR